MKTRTQKRRRPFLQQKCNKKQCRSTMARSNEPKYYKIGNELQATVNENLLRLFRQYHVNIGDRTDFRYVMHRNRRGQYAEDNDGTTDRYDCPTRQFWQFCAETGNYQDMMLLCFVQATAFILFLASDKHTANKRTHLS